MVTAVNTGVIVTGESVVDIDEDADEESGNCPVGTGVMVTEVDESLSSDIGLLFENTLVL